MDSILINICHRNWGLKPIGIYTTRIVGLIPISMYTTGLIRNLWALCTTKVHRLNTNMHIYHRTCALYEICVDLCTVCIYHNTSILTLGNTFLFYYFFFPINPMLISLINWFYKYSESWNLRTQITSMLYSVTLLHQSHVPQQHVDGICHLLR